jgi:hypothetical protein
MQTGVELTTFTTGLNTDFTVDATLLTVLVDNGKTILEEERPWMVLRKTDTSKTVTQANTWQTAIDLSTITDFSSFNVNQDGVVLRLFDGNNRTTDYQLKTFDERLDWKDSSHTCVYDASTKTLYLNGLVPYSGTLYISYLCTTDDIDLTSGSAVWTKFPKRFLPILGYYAIGILKGAIDYDSINRQMLPANQATLEALKNAMVTWDDKLQLAAIQSNDPSEHGTGYRTGAIDRSDY